MNEVDSNDLKNATQVWFRLQRVLRTLVATLASALVAWGAFAAVAPEILAELALVLPGSWVAWLTGAIASITVVAGAISRIMAIPAVNAWLIRIGLGSVPRSAIVQGVDGVTVRPDPKATR